MDKYKVISGAIVKNGKAHKKGDTVELIEAQAKRLKAYVESVEVKQAEQKAAEPGNDYSDLTFDELKKIVDEKELDVEGTGKNGSVKKDDLLKALDQ